MRIDAKRPLRLQPTPSEMEGFFTYITAIMNSTVANYVYMCDT